MQQLMRREKNIAEKLVEKLEIAKVASYKLIGNI